MAESHQALQAFLLQDAVYERQSVAGQPLVKDDATDRCLDDLVDVLANGRTHNVLVVDAQWSDRSGRPSSVSVSSIWVSNSTGIEGEQNVIDRCECLVLALHLVACKREVIAAEDDVLRRNGDRLAARRAKADCSTRASERSPRSALRPKAECARPSGRRRSPR